MADVVGEAKVAPRALYYVVVDGTAAKDSAAFGAMIEKKFGFRNLVGSFLPSVEDQPSGLDGDKDRLVDEAHPYLPVNLHTAAGKKVAVVEPGGRNGKGQDPIWKEYAGEFPKEKPNGKHEWPIDEDNSYETFGRVTALEKSARFMKRFLLDPSIDVTPGTDPIKARIHEEHPELIFPFPDHLLRAELLLVSSHGWLGGYMRGDSARDWNEAKPEEAKPAVLPDSTYFSVGEAAATGDGFRGPIWVILAQCSTVNSATWTLWTDVFANSKPIVRGVLAYEEASPGPAGSITISKRFFRALSKRKTILKAWKEANVGQKWAAIVHKEALGDRMQNWRSFKPITGAETTATSGSYMGFLSSIPDGEEVRKQEPPFELTLMQVDWEVKIGPKVLDSAESKLTAEDTYVAILRGPNKEKINRALVRFIHIRQTYKKQFPFMKIFVGALPSEGDTGLDVKPQDDKKATVIATTKDGPRDEIRIFFRTRKDDDLINAGLQSQHSYLWVEAEVTTAGGETVSHEFKTIGLSY